MAHNQLIEGFSSAQAVAGNFATITTETSNSLSGKDEITHFLTRRDS